MSGEPAPGTVLKRLDEIPDPGGAPADYDALPIIVLRSGDTVRAYVNVCPHAGRPLSLPSGKTLYQLQAQRILKLQLQAQAQTGKACSVPW